MTIDDHDITVRPWKVEDREALLPMVQDCLRVNYQAGADMKATPKNADILVQMGMLAAPKGEPCLVAEVDGLGLVGYTLWCSLPNPLGMEFRGNILHGLGTYVTLQHRRSGLAHLLRNEAEAQALRQGFTKIVGCAYHSAGFQSVLARNYRVAGTLVEKEL